jgi:hypothetical protein
VSLKHEAWGPAGRPPGPPPEAVTSGHGRPPAEGSRPGAGRGQASPLPSAGLRAGALPAGGGRPGAREQGEGKPRPYPLRACVRARCPLVACVNASGVATRAPTLTRVSVLGSVSCGWARRAALVAAPPIRVVRLPGMGGAALVGARRTPPPDGPGGRPGIFLYLYPVGLSAIAYSARPNALSSSTSCCESVRGTSPRASFWLCT